MTDGQKDAIRWARDVAIAGKWEHVKALQELLAAGASDGQAQPVAWADKHDLERLRNGTLTIAGAGAKQRPDNVPLYTRPSAELTALRERSAELEPRRCE